ncbi:MAG: hypothetical protein ACRYGF_09520 [Janthinobacterium lividum]
MPPATHPTEPLATIPVEEVPNIDPQLPRRYVPRFRPLPATAAQLAALAPPPPPPVSLGQLTTGGEADNGTLRRNVENLLRSQQRRLARLAKSAAVSHHQQVEQAALFLRQADTAWKKLDMEGTRTLATKAKLLLDEVEN